MKEELNFKRARHGARMDDEVLFLRCFYYCDSFLSMRQFSSTVKNGKRMHTRSKGGVGKAGDKGGLGRSRGGGGVWYARDAFLHTSKVSLAYGFLF